MKISIRGFTPCLFLICCLMYNCSDKLNSESPLYYSLKVEFTDEAGNDKSEGLTFETDEAVGPSIYEVDKSQYKLQVLSTEIPSQAITVSPLLIQETAGANWLQWMTTVFPNQLTNKTIQLNHKLFCPTIFGNQMEQMIISNWDNEHPAKKCLSIELNDKTYYPSKKDENGDLVFVVVLKK